MPEPDDITLAGSLVREAGLLAEQMLRQGLTTHHKTSVSDVVSAADHAAEALIVKRLRDERPDDGLVGEEGAEHPGERTWYIDPVDGTYNFLSQLPVWCSAVALADPDGPVLGAVYHPAVDELWLGGRGVPTTCNGVEVAPIEEDSLNQLSIVTYLHPTRLSDPHVRDPLLRIVAATATIRMLGSGSVELAAVAGSRLGLWVQIDSLPWDWLPGAALVEAAGGTAQVVAAHGHAWHLAGGRRAVAEATALVLG